MPRQSLSASTWRRRRLGRRSGRSLKVLVRHVYLSGANGTTRLRQPVGGASPHQLRRRLTHGVQGGPSADRGRGFRAVRPARASDPTRTEPWIWPQRARSGSGERERRRPSRTARPPLALVIGLTEADGDEDSPSLASREGVVSGSTSSGRARPRRTARRAWS